MARPRAIAPIPQTVRNYPPGVTVMNKRFYRIVFNKKRGQLMAVAEVATADGKSRGTTTSPGVPPLRFPSLRRACAVATLLAAALSAAMPSAANAQIVAYKSAPASQQPTILSAGNGVPLVNIQTPSAAGVSHNTYSQFDVQSQGAILNNARTSAQTQLGGYVEVAGARAEVVVANPAGVTCNGCGFINASRATLTTGAPIMNGGNLDAYRVEGGTVKIEGAGMDASGTDYANLIARAVEVNAGLWAQTLQVTAGANLVNADNTQATPIAGSGASPAFAVDVAQLGGMYAGKITLVGTEAGVGVRNAGTIGATAGEVVVTLAGRLENTNTIGATGTMQISTEGDVTNSGSLVAFADATIKSLGALDNTGAIVAIGHAALDVAGAINNRGLLQAGATLSLAATDIDNNADGSIESARVSLPAGQLTNRGLIDGSDTFLDPVTLNNLGTGKIFGDHVASTAMTLNNLDENGVAPAIAARTRLDIGATTINNREHALIFSAGDMAVGGALDRNYFASGQATTLNNASATIESLGNLSLRASAINNTNEHLSTEMQPAGTEWIVEYQNAGGVKRYLPSQVSWFSHGDGIPAILTEETWSIGGEFAGERYTDYQYTRSIRETRVTHTDPGQIWAGGNLQLTANTLTNSDSQIIAGGAISDAIDSLNNIETPGERQITDVGSATSHWRNKRKGTDEAASSTTAYAPPLTIQTISMATTAYQENTAPGGSGTQVAALNHGVATQNFGINGDVTISLPNNTLYHYNTNPGARAIVETDPRFADYRTWMSSDYLLQQLALDPATTQKRLGDGFYEQRLVREQIAQLTGQRYLASYADDEIQYRALMDAGVAVAQEWHFVPGVALTAGDLANIGGTIRAENQLIASAGHDLSVASTTRTQKNTQGSRTNIDRVAGLYVTGAGGTLVASAGNDLNLTGAALVNAGATASDATGSTTLVAGHDLTLAAGNNLTAKAATVASSGALIVGAGNDLNLIAGQSADQVDEAHQHKEKGFLSSKTVTTRDTFDQTTALSSSFSGDSVALSAGNDLTVQGSNVFAAADLTASAGRDLIVESAEDTRSETHYKQVTKQSTGLGKALGAITIIGGPSLIPDLAAGAMLLTTKNAQNVTAVGSTLSGGSVSTASGRDTRITGSTVVADSDIDLAAARNLSIKSAQSIQASESHARSKTSGFVGTWWQPAIGTVKQTQDGTNSGTTQVISQVASLGGDVYLKAGETYTQTASQVLALAGDVDVQAQRIDIGAAMNNQQNTTASTYKKTAIGGSVSVPLIDAARSAIAVSKAAMQTSDPRMQALAAATAAMQAKSAYDSAQALANGNLGGIKISVSLGTSKNESHSEQSGQVAVGSTVAAAGDVALTATGAGKDSDLTIQGSNVSAGNNVTLKADDEIKLLAAQNTYDQHSTNKNSGASIGIGFAIGGSQNGFTLELGANKGRGNADGTDTTWTNTHIQAGNLLSLESGGDTTLKGAVASGQQVAADVGGKLVMESLQDTSLFDAKQKSGGFGVSLCIPPFCYGTSTGSVSASGSKIDSNYASVVEQTGLQAGDGGFQVNVQGNTDLNGAVIASSDKAVQDGKNIVITGGTLTLSDIENRASYDADAYSVTLSGSTKLGDQTSKEAQSKMTSADKAAAASKTSGLGSSSLSGAGVGSDESQAGSVTKSGISGIAGDTAVRTGEAQTGIAKIFDADKVQKEINAQVQITQAFGQQASKAVADYASERRLSARVEF